MKESQLKGLQRNPQQLQAGIRLDLVTLCSRHSDKKGDITQTQKRLTIDD